MIVFEGLKDQVVILAPDTHRAGFSDSRLEAHSTSRLFSVFREAFPNHVGTFVRKKLDAIALDPRSVHEEIEMASLVHRIIKIHIVETVDVPPEAHHMSKC